MAPGLPEDVRRFLAAYVDSLESLEVLLLLHARRDRSWTPDEASAELRLSPISVRTRMERLLGHRIFCADPDRDRAFRICVDDPALGPLLEKVADSYAGFRMRVIEFIFSRPLDEVLEFAEAFNLRRKE